jgi:hypothetical protein
MSLTQGSRSGRRRCRIPPPFDHATSTADRVRHVTISGSNLHGSERAEATDVRLAIPGTVGRRTIGTDFQTSMQADASTRNLSTTLTAVRWKLLFILRTAAHPASAKPIIVHDIIPLDELSDPHDPNRHQRLNSFAPRQVASDVGCGGIFRAPAVPRFKQCKANGAPRSKIVHARVAPWEHTRSARGPTPGLGDTDVMRR